jgi:phosphoserine phosphatase RsbU/P
MLNTSVSEGTSGVVQALLPGIRNIDSNFGRLNRIINEDYRLKSDLNLAMAIQRRMLPRNTKQLTTLKYAGSSTAAQAIGGDYYDFLDLGPDSLGFLLADVSGKGIAAALLMANLQAFIRCECARGFWDLSAMLELVNAHFLESTLPEHYATLFFGQYDDWTRRLSYVNCGHQPPILVRADGSVERLETTALPLGMVKDWAGEEKTVDLHPGDSLFLFSDGLIESGLENGLEFSEEGLVSVAAANPSQDIELTVARIAQASWAHAPNGPADDMTIVGMRAV